MTGSLRVEEPVHSSWSRFYTVNYWALAGNDQLSNMKRLGRVSNRRPERLKASTLTATPPSPPEQQGNVKTKVHTLYPLVRSFTWRLNRLVSYEIWKGPQWQSGHTLASHLWGRGQFPVRPQVGKLVVACRGSAVYSTEPWPAVCTGFLCPSNYLSWYDLYSVESNVKP